MPSEDLDRSDVLLIVRRDQEELATSLRERFAGVSGLAVTVDRRRPWPEGERRRQRHVGLGGEERPAQERRREDRRGSHEARFFGALRTPPEA